MTTPEARLARVEEQVSAMHHTLDALAGVPVQLALMNERLLSQDEDEQRAEIAIADLRREFHRELAAVEGRLNTGVLSCRGEVSKLRTELAADQERRKEARRRTIAWLVPAIISLLGVIVALIAILASRGGA